MAYSWEKYTGLEKAQIVSATKRLNERMRDMERAGLTGTAEYKNLSRWVANVPNRVDSTGHVRAVQTYKMSPKQVARTMAVSNNKLASRGGALKRIEKEMRALGDLKRGQKPTPSQIARHVARMEQLHDFINQHQDAYYGTYLQDATHRSGTLTPEETQEFFKLMEDVEQAVQNNTNNLNRYIEEREQSIRGIDRRGIF